MINRKKMNKEISSDSECALSLNSNNTRKGKIKKIRNITKKNKNFDINNKKFN